ncbi:MAG: type II secretion system F family protein [Deltaproteobacteria bacterium]|nr:type II secretion system F family protein [Deltaproteobacteria bacterium]MBZ0219812.1 type II secretion system F family protein [Deltaproteobacteria bacterium]
MARFKVKTGTMDGRVFLKEVEAANIEEARSRLEEEGLIPLEVRSGGFSMSGFRSRVSGSDFLVFNQGFLTLLKAGLQLVEILETLQKSATSQALSAILERVVKDIKSGHPFSEALKAHPSVFPSLYISTIAAGERTGDLIPSIKGYIDFQKRMEAVRKKVVSAASYPMILAGASLLVVAFLITYVVPSFAGVYMSSESELSFGTRALMAVSDFMRANALFFPPAVFIAIFLLRYYLKTGSGRGFLDRLKLQAPGIGDIYRGYSVAKFSRTLGMLLRSGITLPEAMGMSKSVLDNSVLERKLELAVRKVREGGSASEAMAGAALMPEITLRMFTAGERSASLQAMCEEIADFHEQEVEHRVDVLTKLIEPALMIIMGLVIGAIVVLMYMPVFQLGARM